MTSVEYSVSQHGDATVVRIGGRLDVRTAGDVRQRLVALVEQGAARVVLDLSPLEWIDSSGVGALVTLYKRTRTAGGDAKVAGLQGQPREIFRLLRLEAALECLDSVHDAAAKLAAQ